MQHEQEGEIGAQKECECALDLFVIVPLGPAASIKYIPMEADTLIKLQTEESTGSELR